VDRATRSGDLRRFQGVGQFGPAYRRLYEGDVHAAGSVDRVLLERMVRVCLETVPVLYGASAGRPAYVAGSRPLLERWLAEAAPGPDDEARIDQIALFCAALERRAPRALDDLWFGGTEEEIVRRGSAWCTDIARVACALHQVAGLASRLGFLADTTRAYSGHAIVEVHRAGDWGAVDPLTAVVYRHPDGAPAPIWRLMHDAGLVLAHRRADGSAPTSDPDLFRAAAVAEYPVASAPTFDDSVGTLSPYYRSILQHARCGWPGGLRWLHGEDRPA
jgi:hypothetical protein